MAAAFHPTFGEPGIRGLSPPRSRSQEPTSRRRWCALRLLRLRPPSSLRCAELLRKGIRAAISHLTSGSKPNVRCVSLSAGQAPPTQSPQRAAIGARPFCTVTSDRAQYDLARACRRSATTSDPHGTLPVMCPPSHPARHASRIEGRTRKGRARRLRSQTPAAHRTGPSTRHALLTFRNA